MAVNSIIKLFNHDYPHPYENTFYRYHSVENCYVLDRWKSINEPKLYIVGLKCQISLILYM